MGKWFDPQDGYEWWEQQWRWSMVALIVTIAVAVAFAVLNR